MQKTALESGSGRESFRVYIVLQPTKTPVFGNSLSAVMIRIPLVCKSISRPVRLALLTSRAFLHLSSQQYNKKKVELEDSKSPEDLTRESHLKSKPIDFSNYAPVRPGKHNNLLSESKYESKNYQLPKWKEAFGELIIKTLNLDMDKVRSGPVAGSYYYALCKDVALQYEGEELSGSSRFFYEDLKLPRTFSQWFQITILHEWILFVRMRAMPFKYGRNYQQKLVDRTFADIERRLFDEMKVTSGRIVDQYLKDFNTQLRGAVFAYDEGFYTDDATLASALWRNLFGGRKNIDMVHLEAMVRYVRSQLYVLSRISDRDFALGTFKFVPPDESVERLTTEQEATLKLKTIKKYKAMDNDPNILPSDRSQLSYRN